MKTTAKISLWCTSVLLALLFLLITPAAQAQADLQFTQTDCIQDVDEPYGYPERILKQEVKNGRLLLEISMADLCCTTFSGSYTMADKQLRLRYERSGEDACFCACAYSLRYDLPLPKEPFSGITLNGRPLKR